MWLVRAKSGYTMIRLPHGWQVVHNHSYVGFTASYMSLFDNKEDAEHYISQQTQLVARALEIVRVRLEEVVKDEQ